MGRRSPRAKRIRRVIARVLAVATPLLSAAGCDTDISVLNSGPCSGGGGASVFAPSAADAGVPSCASPAATTHPTCASLCSSFGGGFGGPPDGGWPCCMSTTDPGMVECSVTRDCSGRRPAGFTIADAAEHSLGQHLARMALLEGASVCAFRALGADLRRLGAPGRLVRAAHRSKRDEARHFRMTSALARAHGAQVREPNVTPIGGRSLEQVALENAVEGCARETFGALLAHVQAARAKDPNVRAVMRRVARDETAHAELSWAVHRWALTKLERSAKARVVAALFDAARAIAEAPQKQADPSLAAAAGLPRADEMRALARAWLAEMDLTPTAAARRAS